MWSVNRGSRPHHCRTTSRAAAVQRVWPTMRWSASPAWTCSATAPASDRRRSGTPLRRFEDQVGEPPPLPALVPEHHVVLLGPLVVPVGVALPGEPDAAVDLDVLGGDEHGR